MGKPARHLVLPHVVLLLAGCASVAPGSAGPGFRGASGSVAWEVVDIGQVVSTDTQRMRWSYTILLKEMAGSAIQFERLERGSYGGGSEAYGGAITPQPFQRTLPANSEIRESFVQTWGWAAYSPQFGGAATLRPLTVEHRFIGKDAQGSRVTVIARVRLDRSVGKLAKPVPATSPTLPPKALQRSDLETFAGTWRGSYRALVGESTFDVPLEFTLGPDGSFEAGENDPVTNRFRGTLRVQDGKLAYSQRNDSGTLTVHEGDGRRVIFGQVSGPRGSPPTTYSYAFRLEVMPGSPAPPTSSALAPAQAPFSPVDAPVWKRGHEWAFRWESPRGSGTFVWVVDREETVDGVEYYVVTSGPTELYWRKADLAFYMEKGGGEVEERYVPAFARYAWPLAPGKTWKQTSRFERPRQRTTEELATVCQVEAEETITVPAGSFRALKILCQNQRTGSITSARWYSPEVKQVIREERHFSYGIRYRELTSFTVE